MLEPRNTKTKPESLFGASLIIIRHKQQILKTEGKVFDVAVRREPGALFPKLVTFQTNI